MHGYVVVVPLLVEVTSVVHAPILALFLCVFHLVLVFICFFFLCVCVCFSRPIPSMLRVSFWMSSSGSVSLVPYLWL